MADDDLDLHAIRNSLLTRLEGDREELDLVADLEEAAVTYERGRILATFDEMKERFTVEQRQAVLEVLFGGPGQVPTTERMSRYQQIARDLEAGRRL